MNSPARGSPHREFSEGSPHRVFGEETGAAGGADHNPYNVVQHCEEAILEVLVTVLGIPALHDPHRLHGGIDLERARKARADVLAELRAADLRRAEQSRASMADAAAARPAAARRHGGRKQRQPERGRGLNRRRTVACACSSRDVPHARGRGVSAAPAEDNEKALGDDGTAQVPARTCSGPAQIP